MERTSTERSPAGEIGPYTDLDYYEDQKTVRDMERSIESSNALLKRLRQSIESDQYLLDHARRRIAEHPEFSDVSGDVDAGGFEPCGPCAGTGEYPPTGGDECSYCGGEGEVPRSAPSGGPGSGGDR